MARQSGSPLLAFIRRIASSRQHGDLTDGALLRHFAVQHEESAFATLMQRHGPMVLGVCQSILQDEHEAEDVFQATFLVLARKSRSIGKPDSVASWLHGVAYRLAMKARSALALRRSRERQAVTMPIAEPQDEVLWRDLRPVLHEEVDRLPERYRLPFVLCHLEGKTNEEAAELLGWPKGTVLSSLSRARERLRQRLTRRGLALTSGLLAATLSGTVAQAAVPATLEESTLKAALLFATTSGTASGIAAPVLALAEGLLRATLVARLKWTAVILLSLTALGTSVGVAAYRVRTDAQDENVATKQLPENVPQANLQAATEPPQQPAADKNRLQGAWIVMAAEQGGQRLDSLNGRRFIFAGDRFTVNSGRGEVRGIIPSREIQGGFKLEAASPKRIDLNGENWRLQGVYVLDGKELRICLAEADEQSRPVELLSKAGSTQLLIVLQPK